MPLISPTDLYQTTISLMLKHWARFIIPYAVLAGMLALMLANQDVGMEGGWKLALFLMGEFTLLLMAPYIIHTLLETAETPVAPLSLKRYLLATVMLFSCYILAVVAVYGGILLLVVPAIYLNGALPFSAFGYLDKSLGPLQALRFSMSLVYGRWFAIVGRFILLVIPYSIVAIVLVQFRVHSPIHWGEFLLWIIAIGATGLFFALGYTVLYVSAKNTVSVNDEVSRRLRTWLTVFIAAGAVFITAFIAAVVVVSLRQVRLQDPAYRVENYQKTLSNTRLSREVDTEKGFTITIPADWEIDTQSDQYSTFYIAPVSLALGQLRPSVVVTQFVPIRSLEEGAQIYMQGNSTLPGFTLLFRERTTLNGVSAIKFASERSRTLNGETFVQALEEYLVLQNGKAFLISHKNTKEMFPFTKPVTEKVVRTFEVM